MCLLKKKKKTRKAQLKSRELCFIWPTKDLSLEDSLSDHSELFQRDRGGARTHGSFCNKNQESEH